MSTEFKKTCERAKDIILQRLEEREIESSKNIPESHEFPVLACPLEHYLSLIPSQRIAKLNEVIFPGTTLVGRVSHLKQATVLLDVVQGQGKHIRKLYDLDLEIGVPLTEFSTKPKEGDFYKVLVISGLPHPQGLRIVGTLKSPENSKFQTPLGCFDIGSISEQLLAYHKKLSDESYISDLTSSSNFYNKTTTQFIECKLGLDSTRAYTSLILDETKKASAKSLRNKQFDSCATKMTSNATKQIRAGNMEEAEKILNHALSMAPDHVETIVALGACMANREKYSEAQTLFNRALEIEPKHKNALNYLVEMGLSLASIAEESLDWLEATKCYNNILTVQAVRNSPEMLEKVTKALNLSMIKQKNEIDKEDNKESSKEDRPEKTTNIKKEVDESVSKRRVFKAPYQPPPKRPNIQQATSVPQVINPSKIGDKKLKHFSSKDLDLLNNILSRK